MFRLQIIFQVCIQESYRIKTINLRQVVRGQNIVRKVQHLNKKFLYLLTLKSDYIPTLHLQLVITFQFMGISSIYKGNNPKKDTMAMTLILNFKRTAFHCRMKLYTLAGRYLNILHCCVKLLLKKCIQRVEILYFLFDLWQDLRACILVIYLPFILPIIPSQQK